MVGRCGRGCATRGRPRRRSCRPRGRAHARSPARCAPAQRVALARRRAVDAPHDADVSPGVAGLASKRSTTSRSTSTVTVSRGGRRRLATRGSLGGITRTSHWRPAGVPPLTSSRTTCRPTSAVRGRRTSRSEPVAPGRRRAASGRARPPGRGRELQPLAGTHRDLALGRRAAWHPPEGGRRPPGPGRRRPRHPEARARARRMRRGPGAAACGPTFPQAAAARNGARRPRTCEGAGLVTRAAAARIVVGRDPTAHGRPRAAPGARLRRARRARAQPCYVARRVRRLERLHAGRLRLRLARCSAHPARRRRELCDGNAAPRRHCQGGDVRRRRARARLQAVSDQNDDCEDGSACTIDT